MISTEWGLIIGAVGLVTGIGTGAITVAVAIGRLRGSIEARLKTAEVFIEAHPEADNRYRTTCHTELLMAIKEVRQEQNQQFAHLNSRLDNVIDGK